MGRIVEILMLRNAGDGSFSNFTEVEMIDTSIGSSDLCTGGTATASASPQSGSAAGAFANDGTTSWIQWSGATTQRFLRYDFTGTANQFPNINRVNIMGGVGAAARAPGQFLIRQSDDGGSTWTILWECSYTSYTTGVFKTFDKPTGTSFQYWRCRFETCLNNVFSVAEMAMRDTFGGSNLCTGGSGIAYSAGAAIANAFNGNAADYWSSTSINPYEYLGYNFGSAKTIIEISLTPRQDNTWFTQWPETIYACAGPDGVNFLPIWTVPKSLLTYADGAFTFRNPSAVTPGSTHRWWGIRPTALQSGTSFGVRDVEFRATIGGADITTGGVSGCHRPFTSASPIAYATYAFNSSVNEYASTTGLGLSDIIVYDYGHGNEKAVPAQISITARVVNGANNNFNQSPTAFDLVYSDDGHTFTVAESFTTGATWTTGETRTFGTTATGRRRMSFM